jgi:hypothetical protein
LNLPHTDDEQDSHLSSFRRRAKGVISVGCPNEVGTPAIAGIRTPGRGHLNFMAESPPKRSFLSSAFIHRKPGIIQYVSTQACI